MKNLCLLLPIVVVVVFNRSVTNANDIAATTLTLTNPDPTSSSFTEGASADITFTLAYTVTGTGGTPSDVKVYFSDGGSTKSTEVVAGGTNAPSGAVGSSGSFDDLTATITLDAANCAIYTKLCAAITVTDDDTTNNVACIDFGVGATKAGQKICNDIAASTLTVTAPPPATGVLALGTATDITFTLAYTVTGTGGTPTAVKVYASDGASKTSTKVTATGTGAPTSTSSAVTASGSYTGLKATITLDSTNCEAYTKLCAAITVTDDVATNNVVCINFGTSATDAGSKNCNDIAATTLTLTDPDPAKSGFTKDKATEATFTLAYTVTGTGGTPTAVKLYFKNDDATKKSTEVTATGTGAPTSTSAAVTASGSYTGLKATVTLDGTNCEAYTNLCAALIFTTADANTANNEACAVFGVGADKAGKKPCGSGSSATTSSTLMALTMVIGAVLSWKI
ncbi:uncharacterized protein LOC144432767 [Glandiceps talaboti]